MDYDYCKNRDCPMYIGGATHKTTTHGCSYDSMKKTIGSIIDELSITNCKIFALVDKVQKDEHTREDAKKLQELNSYRSKLTNAINEQLGERQEIKV